MSKCSCLFCESNIYELIDISKKFRDSFSHYDLKSYIEISEKENSKICRDCYRKFNRKRCFQKGCNRSGENVSILSSLSIQSIQKQIGHITNFYGYQSHKRILRKRVWEECKEEKLENLIKHDQSIDENTLYFLVLILQQLDLDFIDQDLIKFIIQSHQGRPICHLSELKPDSRNKRIRKTLLTIVKLIEWIIEIHPDGISKYIKKGNFHFELEDCEGRSQVITFQLDKNGVQLMTKNKLPPKIRKIYFSIKVLCEISDEKWNLLVNTVGHNCLLPSLEQLKHTREIMTEKIELNSEIFRIQRELLGVKFKSIKSELKKYFTEKKIEELISQTQQFEIDSERSLISKTQENLVIQVYVRLGVDGFLLFEKTS